MRQGPIAIRPAQVADLPSIEAVARTTWPVAYNGIIPDEVQRRLLDSWYSPAALTRALAAQESMFLVAEWEGSVVGFAQYVRRSVESVELTRIYVLPERQRSGIGTQLLDAGLVALAQEDVRRLTVSVERDNTVGRRFYERMGFAEVREVSQEAQGYLLELVECYRPIRALNS
jgi:ribosomal protein S18 acetylase RimI-like enzyme